MAFANRVTILNITITAHNRIKGANEQRQYPSLDAANAVFERLKKADMIQLVTKAAITADIYVDDIYDDTIIVDSFERAYANGDLRQ